LIRLVSSLLPKEVIEVVVCSKYSLEAIKLCPLKAILLSWICIVSIVSGAEPLSRETPQSRLNIQISLLLGQNFFVISL